MEFLSFGETLGRMIDWSRVTINRSSSALMIDRCSLHAKKIDILAWYLRMSCLYKVWDDPWRMRILEELGSPPLRNVNACQIFSSLSLFFFLFSCIKLVYLVISFCLRCIFIVVCVSLLFKGSKLIFGWMMIMLGLGGCKFWINMCYIIALLCMTLLS